MNAEKKAKMNIHSNQNLITQIFDFLRSALILFSINLKWKKKKNEIKY